MDRKKRLITPLLFTLILLLGLVATACGGVETAVINPPTSTPTPSLTAAEPTLSPTAAPTVLPTITRQQPTPILADKPEPTPAQTPAPSIEREFFNPGCERQPLADLPTQPHPETGELWQRYANDSYGFAFLVPPAWDLVEGQNGLCLVDQSNPDVRFVVGYKWADDDLVITRTGVAAGELTNTGEVTFLGREIERNVLRYEGKDKKILYDNAAEIRINELMFSLGLDDFTVPYETAELTTEAMETADAIVASFELIDRLYVNETYGYSFILPPEWRVSPEWVSGANAVWLNYRPSRSDIRFTIAFKWEDEDDIRIVRTGVADTDEILRDEIEFLGQTIDRNVFRYEDKNKAILYANAGHINVNGRYFTLSLDYAGRDYLAGNLPTAAMESADAIVESFQLLE
jgi:hypothetical protein